MTDERKPVADAFVRILSIALTLAFISGGGTAVWKYIQRQMRRISHEKLTTMHYQGEWSVGEYRECDSVNLPEERNKPELDCIGGSSAFSEKVFNVSFSGGLTYDDEKPTDAIHNWLCRRNSADDPTYSCGAKETPKEQTAPKPAEERQERQLTSDEIENLRQRNECEERFYNRKIYEIGGVSVMAACKQNPNRKP
jgi:hypothetical protein